MSAPLESELIVIEEDQISSFCERARGCALSTNEPRDRSRVQAARPSARMPQLTAFEIAGWSLHVVHRNAFARRVGDLCDAGPIGRDDGIVAA